MIKRKITRTKTASQQFKAAIKYIRKTSPQNADGVKERILHKVNSLEDDVTVHRKDSYKKDNDGSFLYFEFLKYRIAYQVKNNEVFINRVRHTGMEPESYWCLFQFLQKIKATACFLGLAPSFFFNLFLPRIPKNFPAFSC